MPPLNVALAYQGFVDEPVPSAIFDSIESGSAKRISLIALFIGAMLTGAVLSTFVSKANETDTNVAAQTLSARAIATSAHRVYATDKVHPVQVDATDLEHLQSWLSYRVGRELALTPLDGAGFNLLGASAIPDNTTTSSMIVYENNNKQRISIFTRYFVGSYEKSEVSVDASGGLSTLSWEQNGAQHTMVSDIESTTLLNIIDKHF